MRKELSAITVALSFGLLASIISGCATDRTSLVDQGIVSLEAVPSDKVRIFWTDVYEDAEDVVVYGVVRRQYYTSYPMKIHVDVTISSPDGTVLQKARTPDIYVPSHRPGKTVNWKRFEVRFPDIPQDSKVQMVVHSRRHDDTT